MVVGISVYYFCCRSRQLVNRLAVHMCIFQVVPRKKILSYHLIERERERGIELSTRMEHSLTAHSLANNIHNTFTSNGFKKDQGGRLEGVNRRFFKLLAKTEFCMRKRKSKWFCTIQNLNQLVSICKLAQSKFAQNKGDKRQGIFTEVRKLAGFLIPVEASPTPPLNHEAIARPLRQEMGKAGVGPRRGLPKPQSLGAIIEPTQPGWSDRSEVAGQTVHGSVRPPSARSDRLRLWQLCIATKNQTSATDHPGQTDLRPTVRPQVTFQHNQPLVKRRYLLTRVSEFGVLGLYGKLIQRAIQPMNNPSKKHNFSQGERAHTPKNTPPDITT
uniref:Uncharacterized protein n=1 Tax=Oryza sativa subsp. japonica TaxID=39947 RepID=Q7EZR8_ORYSJ|nr:hypothetical protein [Oryza sativa Japonica Group]